MQDRHNHKALGILMTEQYAAHVSESAPALMKEKLWLTDAAV